MSLALFAGWQEKNTICTRFPHDNETQWHPREKIAAFELDNTIIEIPSDFKHTDKHEFKYLYQEMIRKFISLHKEGYAILVISNQPNISKGLMNMYDLQNRFDEVVRYLGEREIPIAGIFSTGTGYNSKPYTGLWCIIERIYKAVTRIVPNKKESFYCGPAGGRKACAAKSQWGRLKADKNYIDRAFAINVGIAYKSPEEFFTDRIVESTRPWEWPSFILTNEQKELYKTVSVKMMRESKLANFNYSIESYVQSIWPNSNQFIVAIQSPNNAMLEKTKNILIGEFKGTFVPWERKYDNFKKSLMLGHNVIIVDEVKRREEWISIVLSLNHPVPVLFLVLNRTECIAHHLDKIWIEYGKVKQAFPTTLYKHFNKTYRGPDIIGLRKKGLNCTELEYPLVIPTGGELGRLYANLII